MPAIIKKAVNGQFVVTTVALNGRTINVSETVKTYNSAIKNVLANLTATGGYKIKVINRTVKPHEEFFVYNHNASDL